MTPVRPEPTKRRRSRGTSAARRRRGGILAVLAIAYGWTAGAVSAAHGQTPPTARRIAHDGFGDPRNSYAWSMAWFKSRLYVGTARSAICVERATIDFFVPFSASYQTHPLAGVTCPPTIDDADLRAEIWRYDPATGGWERVYRSPQVANPRAKGKRVARDIGYRGMVVTRDGRGRQALYVGAMTANEYLPQLGRKHPPRILRTTNGRTFHALGGRPGIITTSVGARRPMGFRAMEVHDGRLYVTASSGLTGDGAVLEVRHPAGRAPSYRQISPNGLSVFELASFGGDLYAGTGDGTTGYGVWRVGERPADWKPVITGGAGRGREVTSVVSMAAYRGHLYVGASGWGYGVIPSSELVRIAPDGTWELVAGSPRPGPDGTELQPISGLPDGLGNPFNSHFWRMQVVGGALLLGTNDWSGTVSGNEQLVDRLRPGFGFDLFASCDGTTWSTVTGNAFGHPDDFGLRTFANTPDGVFMGTTNHVQGASVYHLRGDVCSGPATVAGTAALQRNRRAAARIMRGCAPRPVPAAPGRRCPGWDERKP